MSLAFDFINIMSTNRWFGQYLAKSNIENRVRISLCYGLFGIIFLVYSHACTSTGEKSP